MLEQKYKTNCGDIHYWVDGIAEQTEPQLVFLPGLTADHRLFEMQIAHFEGKYSVFVWDAPGHGSLWPFQFDFNLMDKAKWLDEILKKVIFFLSKRLFSMCLYVFSFTVDSPTGIML